MPSLWMFVIFVFLNGIKTAMNCIFAFWLRCFKRLRCLARFSQKGMSQQKRDDRKSQTARRVFKTEGGRNDHILAYN